MRQYLDRWTLILVVVAALGLTLGLYALAQADSTPERNGVPVFTPVASCFGWDYQGRPDSKCPWELGQP